MASILPSHFVPVTHFTTDPDDREGLASDQEWEEEIEEEIITLCLSRHIDTALLARPPPEGSRLPGATAAPARQSGASVRQGEAGPSSAGATGAASGSSTRKKAAPRHTWSLIGLNTPTPFLKVNNTVFKGKAMETVESEMIMRMKKGTRKGREESEEDQWAPYQIPLLASEHTLLFTPQQLARDPEPDSKPVRSGAHRGPLQRPSGPKKRLSVPESMVISRGRGGTGLRGRGRGGGRPRGSRGGGGGPGSRGGGRGRGRGRGRGGSTGKGREAESDLDELDAKAAGDDDSEGDAHHSASGSDGGGWDERNNGEDDSSSLDENATPRMGSRRSARARKPPPPQPDWGDILGDHPPGATTPAANAMREFDASLQGMAINPAQMGVADGAGAGPSDTDGLQPMVGFSDSD